MNKGFDGEATFCAVFHDFGSGWLIAKCEHFGIVDFMD
jgi:hypothetical protein